MSTSATPPRWAETLLRVILEPADCDSVSGDLLEEYRESIHPVHGHGPADLWYVTQVLGFVFRRVRLGGILFGLVFVVRNALDWFAPPADFHIRSVVSTCLVISLLMAIGFVAAWRSGSFVGGTVAGVATSAIGAIVSIVGAAGVLAIWHDPQTLAAIRAGGGLAEVFTLPLAMVLPGVVFGTIGGLAASNQLWTPRIS